MQQGRLMGYTEARSTTAGRSCSPALIGTEKQTSTANTKAPVLPVVVARIYIIGKHATFFEGT